MKTIKHWVDGKYYEGNPIATLDVENPATGEVEGTLLEASGDDLDHAVEIAKKAQKEWAKMPLSKRTAIMFRMRQLVLDHQDEMARLIVAEHGKNYSDAIGEIQRGRETLDFATSINVALKGEYSSFTAFTKPKMQEALMTAEKNGLISESRFDLDGAGEVRVYYSADQEQRDTINSYIK